MKLTILGSTGSIGTQALCVAKKNGYEISALAAEKNVETAEQQAREFRPKVFVLRDEKAAADLRTRLRDMDVKVWGGDESVCEVAQNFGDTVLNAIVGIAGLRPTMAALVKGRRLALANKESLVTGGELVMKRIFETGCELIPVDSEHSAIFQCIVGSKNPISKIILTASGGPFFGKSRAELSNITAAQALNHPTWSMGKKITIDCATMINKGLEVIEAYWLFGVKTEQIQIVIHRNSIVHSAVIFKDHSVIAQMGLPDMRLPIQYALTYPERRDFDGEPLDLAKIGSLSFAEPDYVTFPAPLVCKKALALGGTSATVANGANEAAVSLFLNYKIGFLQIADLVQEAVERIKPTPIHTLEEIFDADSEAKEFVRERAEHAGG
ncbi:MAG TPA: 1-deoxy-D-xylulose-5-phosphate reductoisomerase [Oscillospiraceae bacterium]|nr:1-deoxy-D-xylulose-5-phosphate reductoisomerase [Oscillospiraceae bacterium]HPS34640.1 1-deoxy-D-xylulose-5-phosphate reductoisomerase [Oscillospiraceae bacterium]